MELFTWRVSGDGEQAWGRREDLDLAVHVYRTVVTGSWDTDVKFRYFKGSQLYPGDMSLDDVKKEIEVEWHKFRVMSFQELVMEVVMEHGTPFEVDEDGNWHEVDKESA